MNKLKFIDYEAPQADLIKSVPSYIELTNFISANYAKHYEANISCCFDNLLVAVDKHHRCVAVVGYRSPDRPFFLEQYLPSSAEEALLKQYGITTHRHEIVEIGNLVGTNCRAVFILMQHLWTHLHQQNYRHAVLTCTKKLRRKFRNLPLIPIQVATPDYVSNPNDWGSYYEEEPYVMTGMLREYDQRFTHSKSTKNFSLHLVQKAGCLA